MPCTLLLTVATGTFQMSDQYLVKSGGNIHKYVSTLTMEVFTYLVYRMA